MKFLGTEPVDDAEAQALITQALNDLQHDRLHAAINGLESAALCASASQLGDLCDTLCTLYVRTHRYRPLATLIESASVWTPPLTLGALVIERNRRQGHPAPANLPPFKILLDQLVQFIGAAKYSFDELCLICSLLTQLGEAVSAVALLDALIDVHRAQHTPSSLFGEELAVAVLTLALDRKLKREAQRLIDKLAALSPDWRTRAARYSVLIGNASADGLTFGTDKVLDFLHLSGITKRSGGHGR